MTAQLTHETRLTSIALSTTSFPIIWCAGHLPAQNNDGHMFNQKLLLCINNGPVIVTGMNSVIPIIWCAGHLPAQNNDCHMFYQKLLLCINDGLFIVTGMNSVGTHFLFMG